jgi:hypothetical protein
MRLISTVDNEREYNPPAACSGSDIVWDCRAKLFCTQLWLLLVAGKPAIQPVARPVCSASVLSELASQFVRSLVS